MRKLKRLIARLHLKHLQRQAHNDLRHIAKYMPGDKDSLEIRCYLISSRVEEYQRRYETWLSD